MVREAGQERHPEVYQPSPQTVDRKAGVSLLWMRLPTGSLASTETLSTPPRPHGERGWGSEATVEVDVIGSNGTHQREGLARVSDRHVESAFATRSVEWAEAHTVPTRLLIQFVGHAENDSVAFIT